MTTAIRASSAASAGGSRSEPGGLAAAIAEAAAGLSDPALITLVDHLRRGSPAEAIREAMPTAAFEATVGRLLTAWAATPETAGSSIALALEALREARLRAPRLSLVWTGPTTTSVPVRRTDQALLQLINHATRRLIIVSFAVYRVPNVATTLERAASRGVTVDLVVETEEASGGRVAFDGWRKLAENARIAYRLWTWAPERRPATASGTRASLHAKCAVADGERLLVSSANLTEFALSLNMELGLLVAGGDVPPRVERHFDALMTRGELERV